MKIIAPLLFLALATALFAEPMQISRQQAADLFVALVSLEPGLTPENTVTASDNIIALRPIAESLDKGKFKAQLDIQNAAAAQLKPEVTALIVEAIAKKGDEVITVDLTRFEISLDEIKAAKIRPKDFSYIRQWLKPPSKK